MVRAKFLCTEVGKTGWQHPESIAAKVVLNPVSDGSEENKQFFKATPSGKIEMNVMNPQAAEQFEVGKFYYVDFTLATS